MDQQESSSTSDLGSQSPKSNAGETSKIPRKSGSQRAGSQIPQSSRIPMKRADVNSNVASRERPGKETAVSKRTAPVDSKTNGTAASTSSKQASNELKELSEPTIPKQSAVSNIPVKGGSKSQKQSGIPRLPLARQDGGDLRGNGASKITEQNQIIDRGNESAMQEEKSTLKREGTGDELRLGKNDATKSKLPKKSSIPKSNIPKTSQPRTSKISNTEVETKVGKTSLIPKTRTTSLKENKTNALSPRREPAEVNITSNTLQRSDSGYGDMDSVSSKEDTPTTEAGNEFSLSRENSKSKIPIKPRTTQGSAKSSRDGTTTDEKKPNADTTKADNIIGDANVLLNSAKGKLETDTKNNNEKGLKVLAKTNESDAVYSEMDKTKAGQKSLNIVERNVENVGDEMKENFENGLETTEDVVTSRTESRESDEEEVKLGVTTGDVTQDKGGKILEQEASTGSLESNKRKIQNGGSLKTSNGLDITKNVSMNGHEKILQDHDEKKDENTDKNNVGVKLQESVSNKKQVESLSEKKSLETVGNVAGNDESKTALRMDTKRAIDIEKQAAVSLERSTSNSEEETAGRKTKQSPRKPPRLSKLLSQNDHENNQELSAEYVRPADILLTKEGDSNNPVISLGDAQAIKVSKDIGLPEEVGQAKEVGVTRKVEPSTAQEVTLVGGPLGTTGGMSLPRGAKEVGLSDEVGHNEGEGVEEQEEPPRRSDNCMQCRMEQSMLDGEDISKIQNDPGFRQYPTFISPRKSLVTCKHHSKQTDDTDIAREQPLVPMASLTTKPGLTLEVLNMSKQEPSEKDANIKGIKSPSEEQSRELPPPLNTTEKLGNPTRNGISRSESLKTPRNTVAYESRQFESKTLPKPKGSHSPLLALSRDKKFAQKTKPSEDIKTALSLEWDDTWTELSPPNFSDDDEECKGKSDDLRDNISPTSVKLMNTNEALDKLKVIQNLIMKEAENRSRKGSEENAGKSTVGSKNPGNDIGNHGAKYESTSNQVSPTLENPGRKASSPTIWDRITDNTTISQDQTTELLNETLAKLKASPKLSSNSLPRRTLSSRSLPGSRQESKEQLLSDGERPVYVYTSSWMNTSGKNSRGSTLSLCSNNRSLPSSRQNLTKEPGLKRSESAAGRMEKENGKRLEPKERKEYRLSDFDEINLSDDMNELRSQKATTPHQTPAGIKNMDGVKPLRRSKRRSKKKSKNTAESMNNMPAYGVSMDDLAEGKTQCQCGGNKCVIS